MPGFVSFSDVLVIQSCRKFDSIASLVAQIGKSVTCFECVSCPRIFSRVNVFHFGGSTDLDRGGGVVKKWDSKRKFSLD
jgi:hypothetical protein